MKAQAQSNPDTVRNEAPTWRTMTVFAKVGAVILWVVFVLYLVFLLKLLLFSRLPGSERSLNLIPFATISDYLFSGSAAVKRFAIDNVIGNIVAFVPIGAFLPLLRRKTGIWTNLLIVACASVAVEIIQGVFGLGASDIDDVILNSLGGLIGILFFKVVYALLRRWSRVITVMALLSLLGVPILYYLLVAIRLRI